MFIDFAERDSARAGNRAIVRRRAGERERHRLDQAGHLVSRHRAEFSGGRFLQQARSPAATVPRPCAGTWTAMLSARLAERRGQLLLRHVGPQVDGAAWPRQIFRWSRAIGATAHRCRRLRDHNARSRLRRAQSRLHAERDALERLPCETLAKISVHWTAKPQFAGRSGDTAMVSSIENIHPSAIRAEFRPAAPAECENGRVRGIDGFFSVGSDKSQRAGIVSPGPAMTNLEHNASTIEPPQPRAQEWRGFHHPSETRVRWCQ